MLTDYELDPKEHISTIEIQKFSLKKVDGLVQDCSNSIANALELLQSCTKPSMSSTQCVPCYQVLHVLAGC